MKLEFTTTNNFSSMKKIFLKSVLLMAVVLGTFSSCVNDDSYGVPETTLVTYDLTPTTTVAAVNTAATASPV